MGELLGKKTNYILTFVDLDNCDQSSEILESSKTLMKSLYKVPHT